MIRIFFWLLTLTILLPSDHASAEANMISLTIPETVLSQALDKTLPLAIDTNSGTLRGAITIVKINDLHIQEKGIACRIALKGDDMQLHTDIGGHSLKLKVGSLQLGLQCNAALRFDPGKQLLYVKPVISDLQANSSAAQGDVDAMLMALLNNREFPVKMKQMQPLIAETSGKTISINMNIAGVRTRPGLLQFDIYPQIESSGQATRKK